MIPRFNVPKIAEFEGIAGEVQVAFHGINKSGSLAMAKVIRDAYGIAGRQDEFFPHYFRDISLGDYIDEVATLRGPAFLAGHYLYGNLPPTPGRVLVTLFRHPLPRVLSSYNWTMRKAQQSPGPVPTLDAWVERSKGKAFSQIIQFGCGHGRHSRSLRALPNDAIFELCIDAIEREVFCFGLAEQFEESIFLFAALCGLPQVRAWKRDVRNAGRPLSSEIPDASRQLIEEVFRYDFELYDYAVATFRKRIAGIDFGPDLQRYKDACAPEYRDRLVSS